MAASDSVPVLALEGLKVDFDTHDGVVHAVRGVSLTVNRGEVLGVVGESGCGKSLVLKSLIGIMTPDAGSLLFDGEEVAKYTDTQWTRLRPRIGMLRGKYVLSNTDANGLNVRFTKLFSVKNDTTQAENMYDLPPFAEAGRLQNRLRTLPALFVRLFFEGGTLRELYTDGDVRILLGSNGKNFKDNYLYVMSRVK